MASFEGFTNAFATVYTRRSPTKDSSRDVRAVPVASDGTVVALTTPVALPGPPPNQRGAGAWDVHFGLNPYYA